MNTTLSVNSELYPKSLKKISDPPKELYCKGIPTEQIFSKCLSVVGSRRSTTYGLEVTNKLVSEVAARGITIVSGFMYGIDAAAHEAALVFNGKTIAVMPCGIDLVRPAYQKNLYKKILVNKGLIMSEYDAKIEPRIWTFYKRNRIVAGLSMAVLVIEAAKDSGSLITARFAHKYKRKILVVPHNITSINSAGVTKLLKEGAIPVDSASDILRVYEDDEQSRKTCVKINEKPLLNVVKHKNGDLESNIMNLILREPQSLDMISRNLSVDISQLNSLITLMILKGLINEVEGKLYAS